ncbi:hypothetical protein [Bradyrhizobium sp. SZCCHNRI1058]|uniref:hypothetical protein n=1 Tax=Bradyrhizobium sp. SZCCHNRI1058 TaxID=3057279 RepID=UPI0029170CC8|nr:hypothetical protein [Bradyrhizobium sp. SZCCHNRI1058]
MYDPLGKRFAVAISNTPSHQKAVFESYVEAVLSGNAAARSTEMLVVSFRGGPTTSRPERGASPVRKVVDRVASPRSIAEVSQLCLQGLALFERLDRSIEGLLCSAMAASLLKQRCDPLEARKYLRRAMAAFQHASLAAQRDAVASNYRKVDEVSIRAMQPELPLDLKEKKIPTSEIAMASHGFSTRHAAGFSIEIPEGRAGGGPALVSCKRTVVGYIPRARLCSADLMGSMGHATVRPSVFTVGRRFIVGQAVKVRAVLDGELPTLLGLAGKFTRSNAGVMLRLQAENARVRHPILIGKIGRVSTLTVNPLKPGLVRITVSFLPEVGAATSASVTFRALQDVC